MSARESRRRIFLPLSTRLTVPLVVLVAAVALGVYWGVVRTSSDTAFRSKEVAADMVVKLTSLSVMPAVVFGDEVEMKRAVSDLARNPEVTDVELWGAAEPGQADVQPLAEFHRPGGRTLGRPSVTRSERHRDADSVRLLEPITSPEGKHVGMLAVRFSTEREAAALATLSRQILYASFGTALCLTLAILFVLTRLVVSPIRRLERAAESLARGGEGAALQVGPSPVRFEDEVVRLGSAFREMAAAVKDREERLAVRNGELRLILDSVGQGFVTALPDGTLLPERSAVIERWLGSLPAELKIWDLAARIDPLSRGWAEMAWSQIADGFLPLDVAVEQLPKRLVNDGRHFDFAYHVVVKSDTLDRLVVVLTDVTAEVERERALAEQHEFSVLVDQFVRDRRAFYDFWNEASHLVDRIVSTGAETADARHRDLHTLKGNARFFGLKRLAELCHQLEDSMHERGERELTAAERRGLSESWESLRRRMEPVIHGATSFVEISEDEYERLARAVHDQQPHSALEELIRGLRREPTAWRLGRARDLLHAACTKLGKTPVEVVMEHNDLRLPPGPFAPFWSVFSHVLNNAVDHGIEDDDVRRQAGKAVPGTVQLSTRLENRELVVEVRDDGGGIDWERVRAVAAERKLPHASKRDLLGALLSEGFSLKADVSDVSGRGVGLSAVGNVVSALGGRVELDSTERGTTWRFRLPAHRIDADDTEIGEASPKVYPSQQEPALGLARNS